MILKGIIYEDFVNYKEPCMTLIFPKCSFKCEKEYGLPVCQNGALVADEDIDVNAKKIVEQYICNPITKAVVCQGLEPFDSWEELCDFILHLRKETDDEVVIYTGYTEEEAEYWVSSLRDNFKNIIIKFGRYIPNQVPHKDPVLGVNLSSDNQYAKKIC